MRIKTQTGSTKKMIPPGVFMRRINTMEMKLRTGSTKKNDSSGVFSEKHTQCLFITIHARQCQKYVSVYQPI